jgi:hypothetical protein
MDPVGPSRQQASSPRRRPTSGGASIASRTRFPLISTTVSLMPLLMTIVSPAFRVNTSIGSSMRRDDAGTIPGPSEAISCQSKIRARMCLSQEPGGIPDFRGIHRTDPSSGGSGLSFIPRLLWLSTVPIGPLPCQNRTPLHHDRYTFLVQRNPQPSSAGGETAHHVAGSWLAWHLHSSCVWIAMHLCGPFQFRPWM